jgi:hypothetical protein
MADVACLSALADTSGLFEVLYKWAECVRLDREFNFDVWLRHHVTDEKHGWMLHWAVADWIQSAGRMLVHTGRCAGGVPRIYAVVPKPWDETGIEVLQQSVYHLFDEMGCELQIQFEPESLDEISVTNTIGRREAWARRRGPFGFEGRGFERRQKFVPGGMWKRVMEMETVWLDLTNGSGRLDDGQAGY